MKHALFVAASFSAFLLSGCHSSADSNTPVQPTDSVPAPPAQTAQSTAQTEQPQVWTLLYSDRQNNDVRARYERAASIVKKTHPTDRSLSDWSMAFGQWIIVLFDPAPTAPDMIVLDAPTPRKPAWLVDMASKTLIETSDWRAALPFFKAQINAFNLGFDSDEEKLSFIHKLASAASVVGFGHPDFIETPATENQYPAPVHGPILKHGMDTSTLTYFVASNGSYIAYTRCEMTITKTNIVFNSEIIQPE